MDTDLLLALAAVMATIVACSLVVRRCTAAGNIRQPIPSTEQLAVTTT